jgi:hypothetical protein
MNNILYLVNYNKNEHLCPAICYQILNQNKECTLLSIFYSSTIKDSYYHYFIQQTRGLKFLLHKENLIKDIVFQYPNHNWYVFLSPLALYDREFSLEIVNIAQNTQQTELIFYPHNEKENSNNYSIMISKNKLLDYIKNELDIDKILSLTNSNTSITKIPSVKSVAIKNVEEESNLRLHEDEFCIFAKFLGVPSLGLSDSFVYINKKNNRTYNIVNNIIGLFKNRDENHVSIYWNNTDKQEETLVKYRLNLSTKEYVPI